MKKITTIITCILVILSGASSASATVGLRGGFGLDPDQIVFGLQARLGKLAEVIKFAPSVDVGFGDNVTSVAVNTDFQIPLHIPETGIALYLGIGPTLGYFNHEKSDSDTEVGATVMGGTWLSLGGSGSYNLEARFGMGDVPEFRLLLGFYF